VVWEGPVDYYVIINAPPHDEVFDPKKTVVFQMEPNMAKHKEKWLEWADPDPATFLHVFKHQGGHYNNVEWHLSKTYKELSAQSVVKDSLYDNVLSTVLSDKYHDPGQVKRIDFVKFLEGKGAIVHVFGDNKWNYANYKGPLPYHCKDKAIFPYKYTFNAENHDIPNYFTEKIIDDLLGKSLVFYYGCFNLQEYFDPRAFVRLTLSNFEKDYQTIQQAMKENWYEQRLPYIREAKQKILNQYQFFPRLEKLLTDRTIPQA